MKILLVNDDGYDSPALIPTLDILSDIGDVTAIIPKYQQSWTSKINTRYEKKLELNKITLNNHPIYTLDGYPADCANFGIYMNDKKPDLLISGANVGHNVGLHAFHSSGTIGGAIEGVLAGIPSIAVSATYSKGQDLTTELFAQSLPQISQIIKKFYFDRPEKFAMLSINLPLGLVSPEIKATLLDRFNFGSLFKQEGDDVIARHYYELHTPESDRVNTDTWAKKNKYTSITAFDDLMQLIPLDDLNQWLVKISS